MLKTITMLALDIKCSTRVALQPQGLVNTTRTGSWEESAVRVREESKFEIG